MSPTELLALPKDTRVWVSEDGQTWIRRYLSHTERSIANPDQINAITYPMGCDSWTAANFKGSGMNPRLTVWVKWRLA